MGSGDGRPPMHEWLDVLKRVQAAARGFRYTASPGTGEAFHRELSPGRSVLRERLGRARSQGAVEMAGGEHVGAATRDDVARLAASARHGLPRLQQTLGVSQEKLV
jgi:hypothetical protein